MPRPALLSALLCLLAGCREPASPPGAAPDAGARRAPAPGLLEPGHVFRCSPDPEVGCRGVFPPRDGSQAAILWGGEDALRARIASLKAARRSIRIQALIYKADEAGLAIAELLKQKKREGLEVRVIVDALSNLSFQTQWMYFDLKRHGIEVEGYEALYLQWVSAEVKPSDPLRPNKRFHDKLWIVDAELPGEAVAIVGGLNLANEYFRVDPTPANRWHDQDLLLRGAIVGDVTQTFERNYAYCKALKRRLPPLANPDEVWRLTRATLQKIKATPRPSWTSPAIGDSLATILREPAKLELVPVRARFLQSRPRLKETTIEQAYLSLIAGAREQVLLANAYFIPWRELSEALRLACRRGVRVVVLTNSPETNDISSVATVSRATYRALLEGCPRLELYEWAGALFKEGTLHAKYGVFDAELALVGSFNLDPRSARLNSETAVAIREPRLAAPLARHFLRELLPKARRISLEEARGFARPESLADSFKLLFAMPLKEWL